MQQEFGQDVLEGEPWLLGTTRSSDVITNRSK
jgi:hypothetical protein